MVSSKTFKEKYKYIIQNSIDACPGSNKNNYNIIITQSVIGIMYKLILHYFNNHFCALVIISSKWYLHSFSYGDNMLIQTGITLLL